MDSSSSLNATRPRWDQTADSLDSRWHVSGISAAHRTVIQDQERIISNVTDHQHSRPIDFIKLVGLWAAVNQQRNENLDAFRVEGPISFSSAKTLGRGLSFDVILIPVEDRTKQQLQLRSSFVVYKKLRGLTDTLDTLEKGDLLRAALLEVRVLTHPPLKNHPNIIRLLQLIWEPDPDLLDHAWPIIVLEHAENGTLVDFQIDYPDLPFSLKKQLCVDVGNGLLALHATSIVHGDLKSENVLICDTDHKGRVVAKLADFGCAITDLEASDTLKLPAFTMPWNAPECHDRLPRDFLKYSDVYSYGLLIWRTALGGVNPFRLIDGLATLDTTDFQREVEQLKLQGHIIPVAKSTLNPPFCNTEGENYLISSALELTLRVDALTRDLPKALRLLSEPCLVATYPEEPLMQYKYENVNISLPTSAMIPMALQLSVIRELEALPSIPGSLGGFACLKLFEIYLDRLEWPGAAENSAKWYLKATEKGSAEDIVGYTEGVFELLQHPVPAGIELIEALKACALRGCYHSLMELRRRSPSDFPVTQQTYRRRGGIQRRSEKHRTFGLHLFGDFEKYFNDLENKCAELDQTPVSESGDLLLHVASRHGCIREMDKLLSLGTNIDFTNRDGETALFQSCRIDNLGVTEFLLSRGANVALAADNGETPLHWLFSFDDQEIEQAAQLLISYGGQPCLFAAVAKGDSSTVESLPLYGTPLHYAILARNEVAAQVLLGAGADPFIGYEDELSGVSLAFTPFRLALLELLPSVIKIMINLPIFSHTFQRYWGSQEETLYHSIVQGSSNSTCRLALRAKYSSTLIEVIGLLQTVEKGERHNVKALEEPRVSLLHTCILHGIPVEVVEYLLKTRCKEDMELISGVHKHTPLQSAMYLNRREVFLLLLSYGADINQILQSPAGFSYVQFCVYLGANAVFFASELIIRGAVLQGRRGQDFLADFANPCGYPPGILALMMGNFELATMFLACFGQPPYMMPRWRNVFTAMFEFLPRLPVSRLRYLLEPPDGFEPVPLNGFWLVAGKNCFHSLSASSFKADLEMLVNFRYLHHQSIRRGQEDLINELDVFEASPLTVAVILGHIELVQEMLNAGAKPNIGAMTSVNWAYLFLKRLQKAPTQPLTSFGGMSFSKREARWLQEDYISIIKVLKQHGGQEFRDSNGMIKMPVLHLSSLRLKAFKKNWDESYQVGREHGREGFSQHGLSKQCLHQVWSPELNWGFRGRPRKNSVNNPLSMITEAIQSPYIRYQAHREAQDRFSDHDCASLSQHTANSSILGGLGSSVMGKIEGLVEFVKWYGSSPAQEIEDPSLPHSPFTSLSSQSSYAPGVFSPIETEQQLSPVQNPITDPQQTTPGAGTPEFHIHTLAQQLLPILSSYASDPDRLRFCVQQCFDTYFSHAGTGTFIPDTKILTGAPLGSLFVLELENGLNNLLRGHFHVMILKRDQLLKAVIHSTGQTPGVAADPAQNLGVEGWMGWKELEEKEAEILLDTFSKQCEVERVS